MYNVVRLERLEEVDGCKKEKCGDKRKIIIAYNLFLLKTKRKKLFLTLTLRKFIVRIINTVAFAPWCHTIQ